jgi:hypothetical protein
MAAATRPMWPHCPWCEKHHVETYCCPPVRQYLAAMRARGDSLTMPSLAFPEAPIAPLPGLGQPGDALMAQVVVQAAVVPVAGVARAGLLFTGRDASGKPLPRWLFVDTDEHIADTAQLVNDMAKLAIDNARSQRSSDTTQTDGGKP